jgi:hypothetical protein
MEKAKADDNPEQVIQTNFQVFRLSEKPRKNTNASPEVAQ